MPSQPRGDLGTFEPKKVFILVPPLTRTVASSSSRWIPRAKLFRTQLNFGTPTAPSQCHRLRIGLSTVSTLSLMRSWTPLPPLPYPSSMRYPCRSPDSWPGTDHAQISLFHSPTPPKCSMGATLALINNLGIVYHQYCSSSYLDYPADPGSSYRSRQWKSSSNLIPTRPPRKPRRVSKGTEYPELAFANALALIIIIAILYSTRPDVAKKTTPQ